MKYKICYKFVIMLSFCLSIFICSFPKNINAQNVSGHITKVSDNLVAIDIGSNHGVKIGDKFRIYRHSGNHRQKTIIEVGVIRIIKTIENKSVGKIIKLQDNLSAYVGDFFYPISLTQKQTSPFNKNYQSFLISPHLKQDKIDFKGFIGLGNPLSPKEFVDYWSKHISLGCGFMFRDNEPFGGLLRINYNSFSLKDDNFLSGKNSLYGNVSVSGGMLKILSFSSNIFISLTSTENKFQIYFFGGGGFYKLKYERIKISTNLGDYYVPEDLKVKSGVNIGTEIEARIYKNFGLNLQCLFHTIFFQESENFNYITLQLGLVLHSDD